MTIPLIVLEKGFPAGPEFEHANLKGIALTIAELLDMPPAENGRESIWCEGKANAKT